MIKSMSCLAIIQSARGELSANQKKLADFILDNAPLIRDYSSQQIAGSVGVSQSSVVKFSQRLGYKGFTDLKLAIHESVVKQRSHGAALDNGNGEEKREISLRQRLSQSKCEVLKSTASLNDQNSILTAVGAIGTATRVEVVGVGGAHIIAKDLAFKLMRLGKPSISEGDALLQLSVLATLSRGDCLVVISASGQAPGLIELAKQAKKSGVTIISLTNQSANPVSAVSDIRLYSISRGDEVDVPSIVGATSQQHVVDLLFCSMMEHVDADRVLQAKSDMTFGISSAK